MLVVTSRRRPPTAPVIIPPTAPAGAPDGINELIGTQYGGYTDNLTGLLVPYKTTYYTNPPSGSNPPYGAHDGGARLHGFGPSVVDWSDGASNWLDPLAAPGGWAIPGLAPRHFLGVWNHAWCLSAENRGWVEWTDPVMFIRHGTTWTTAPYPTAGNMAFWASWITPPFNFQTTPIEELGTTPGGTPFAGVNLTTATLANNYFLHSAPNHWYPRYDTTTGGVSNAISVQCWMRLRAFPGVDPATMFVVGGFSGDTYTGATDNLGNPAIVFPRLKRLPSDGVPGGDGSSAGSWRLSGYSQQSLSDMIANPPPIISYPA